MGVTQPLQIVNAVQNSEMLELNEEKTMLRRKGMDKLPEFQGKKKVKIDENKEEKNGDDIAVNPYDNLETYHSSYHSSIFSLKLDKDEAVPFRYIQ
jgi:hypothetical protein